MVSSPWWGAAAAVRNQLLWWAQFLFRCLSEMRRAAAREELRTHGTALVGVLWLRQPSGASLAAMCAPPFGNGAGVAQASL